MYITKFCLVLKAKIPKFLKVDFASTLRKVTILFCMTVAMLSCHPQQNRNVEGSNISALENGTNGKGISVSSEAVLADSHFQNAKFHYERAEYDEGLIFIGKAIKIREQLVLQNTLPFASDLELLGKLLLAKGNLEEAREQFERSIEIQRAHKGNDHIDISESLMYLGVVYSENGELKKGEIYLKQALKIREAKLGVLSPSVGACVNRLGYLFLRLQEPSISKIWFERAISIFESTSEPSLVEYSMALNGLGAVYRRLGQFSKAHTLILSALEKLEEANHQFHPQTASTLYHLAKILRFLGNKKEAMHILNRAFEVQKKLFGLQHPDIAMNRSAMAEIYLELGQMNNAKKGFFEALQIFENTIGLTHSLAVGTLVKLGEVHQLIGDAENASALFARSLELRKKTHGSNNPYVAIILGRLAELEAQQHHFSKAEDLYERALKIQQAALGPRHPDVAYGQVNLARLKHVRGNFSEARDLYELARKNYLTFARTNFDLDDRAIETIIKPGLKALSNYSRLLAMMVKEPRFDSIPPSAIGDSFKLAEQMRGWMLQASITKAMRRSQQDKAHNNHLVRKFEELRGEQLKVRKKLTRAYSNPLSQQESDELMVHRTQAISIQKSLESLVAELEVKVPRYSELVVPNPGTLDHLIQFLAPDEALISYYLLEDRIQIWLIKVNSKGIYREVFVSKNSVSILIDKLRKTLILQHAESTGDPYLAPVDVDSAFELYQLLLAPIEKELHGVKNLMVVPDESLLSLPFASLITENKSAVFKKYNEVFQGGSPLSLEEMIDYSSIAWLGKDYTLTFLPSASMLKLIALNRLLPKGPFEAFIGFGDPIRGTSQAEREMVSSGIASEGLSIDEVFNLLPSLPGTREELLTMATVFEVNPETHLFLGPRATERRLRKLNESGRLGQTKVLAFATHGLLAGQFGLEQSALVLTPENPDDGLLYTEEILQMSLPNTDWVVLSACNTAVDDGNGQGVSGLTRAFFYAGAKNLFVSHWEVNDFSTRVLMTEVFQRYTNFPNLTAREAVKGAVNAVLDLAGSQGYPSFLAHPYSWAPFFLVGDGRPHAIH